MLLCFARSVLGISKSFAIKCNAQTFVKPELCPRFFSISSLKSVRNYSAAGSSSIVEQQIKNILQTNFPLANEIEVQDVSGGCGSMFQIYIEAEEFRGKRLVEQQRMVNAVLEEQIKGMHGLSLQTAVPTKSNPKSDPKDVSAR